MSSNIQYVVNADELKELLRCWFEEFQSLQKSAQNNEDEGELLTPTEFADKNKVSKTTIWRWVKSGVLRQTIIGNKVYYRQCDLKIIEK